jgi:large-conductance mechanosensitive channel
MKGFKQFLMKNQVLGLAVAVIMGGAIGKVNPLWSLTY